VFIVYGLDGPNEKLLGLRAPGSMSGHELTELCERVTTLAEEIKEFRRKEDIDNKDK
jgi:3-dehydroquinate dehydratase